MEKIALVTGGSRGLGRNMALRLADSGVDVIITYRNRREEADAVAEEIRSKGRKAEALQLDTERSSEFPTFVASLSQRLNDTWSRNDFDFLVNNAGVSPEHEAIAETPEAEFDRLMNIHFKGVYFLTQALLPMLADGGSVVNLSTGLARFTTNGYAAYASMKGAIEVFTRYLAKELGPRSITANTVAPGIIRTDFTEATFEHAPEAIRYIASQTALGRTGRPEDIGGIVAFLCSDHARWITAQRIEASGGMFL